MNTYIIDIETKPLEANELKRLAPEFKADSRLKDPVKIAEDLKSKEAAFFDKAALSALTSSVFALGVWEVGKNQPVIHCNNDEKVVIAEFNKLIQAKDFKLVTFNGNSFDIPFLCRRGLKHGFNFFKKFYKNDGGMNYDAPLIDIAAMWDCRAKTYPSLNDIAVFFGVGGKSKSEELFYQVWEKDQAAATKYLYNDLDLTKKIAETWGVI
jgi:DNA polymerase elongation subunit (family B)